jgi:predicted DNA binding protein
MDDRLQCAPIGILAVSPDGVVTGINKAARSLIAAGDDPVGSSLAELFPRSVDDSLVVAFEGDSVTETSFEEYYPDLERWLDVSVVSTDDGIAVYVRNVTDRKRHEQSVKQLQTERKRTAIIEAVLSDTLAELVGATSREEIIETICRSLGETELYEFAWIGEREIGSDDLVIQAVAGETGETFAAVRDALDNNTVTTVEERAIESGRLQSAQPLADNSQVPDSVLTAGFADGVQSALSIPLVYGSNVYGVVSVYAAGAEAFSDRERASFEMLGEVAGFAVTAARNRSLVLSDSVAELTFEVGDSTVLSRLSQSLDSTLRLEGLVPHTDDALLCFVSVEHDDVQEVENAAKDLADVVETRSIREYESSSTVQLTVQGSTPLLAISSLGGTVRRANFDSGTGRIAVELPSNGDVRRIADTVSREYDLEFIAKSERERSVATAREFRDGLNDALTERQRTALRTAYLADYFESPRGSTAEEVASSLDITGSTLLYHLRAGQRKLLDAYLDENTSSQP